MTTKDLSKFETAEGAAKALHEAVREAAADLGQNPDIEVALMSPEQSEKAGYGKVWRVMWEAGPSDWGVTASLGGGFGVIKAKWQVRSTPWFLEPYYGFDVGFPEA